MKKLKKILFNPCFTFLLRVVLGIVFIYASLDKIANPEQFSKAIRNYHFLPVIFINIFALVLPMAEILAGLCLLSGFLTRSSALTIGLLLFIFIIAISSALIRGIDINCGCFSTSGGEKVEIDLLIRDILMLLAVMIIYIFESGKITLDRLILKWWHVEDLGR